MSTRTSLLRLPRLPYRAMIAGWAFIATVLLVLVTAHATVVMVAAPSYTNSCSLKVPYRLQAVQEPRWLGGEPTWTDTACSVTTGTVPGTLRIDEAARTVTATIHPTDRATDGPQLQQLVPVLMVSGEPRRGNAQDNQPFNPWLDALDAITPLADIPYDTTSQVLAPTRATNVSADGFSASWHVSADIELDRAAHASVMWVPRERASQLLDR